MPRPHCKLRARIMEKGMQQYDIEEALKKSHSYISARMNNKLPWNLDAVYSLCKILDIPQCEIPEYFPPIK